MTRGGDKERGRMGENTIKCLRHSPSPPHSALLIGGKKFKIKFVLFVKVFAIELY